MASIKLKGDTSGEVTISAPSVAGTTTLELPATSSTLATQNSLGVRNLIINGDMRIAQRGTSRVFGQGYKSIDRWSTAQYQVAGQQQVAVTDSNVPSKYALRASSSSVAEVGEGSRIQMGQLVESVNSIHCTGKQVTLSFWIRFSSASITAAAGNFGYGIYEYDTADQNFITSGASRDATDTILNGSFPTTWTKYTKTITCASTMKNLAFRCGFNHLFNTTNNSDVWYDITGVQLEVGTEATPFEHRPYDMELARCQRYYYTGNFSAQGTTDSAYNREGMVIYLPVLMRATPNLNSYTWLKSGHINGSESSNPANIVELRQSSLTLYWNNTSPGYRALGYYGNISPKLEAEL